MESERLKATRGSRFSESEQNRSFEPLSRSRTNLPATDGAEPSSEHEAEHTNASPTFNVVLFGETGVGKSSVINLIAQKDIAKVSNDVDVCTTQSARYDIPFDGMNFSIFDTMGLNGKVDSLRAIEYAYKLIVRLKAAAGIHLLLFCLRGERITATALSNYRLFCECLCSTKVPIVLVFTGLELEERMEDWWERNRTHVAHYDMHSVGHACITAVRDETPEQVSKYTASRRTIRKLLKRHALREHTFPPDSWFARLGERMKSFIAKRREPGSGVNVRSEREDILIQRCKMDPNTARWVTDMMKKVVEETDDDGDLPIMAHIGEPNTESGIEEDTVILEESASDGERDTTLSHEEVDKLTEETIRGSVDEILLDTRKLGRPTFVVYQAICNALERDGRIMDAIACFRQMQSELVAFADIRDEQAKWERDFQRRCMGELQKLADCAMNACEYDIAVDHLSELLSLDGVDRTGILVKFTSEIITRSSVEEALRAVRKFGRPDFVVYRTICDFLEHDGRVTQAVSCFRQMQSELAVDAGIQNGRVKWERRFQRGCASSLQELVDVAINDRKYDTVVDHLSDLLSLDGVNRINILLKFTNEMMIHSSVNEVLQAIRRLGRPEFVDFQTIYNFLEEERIVEAISCFRQMQRVITVDAGIQKERVKWERGFQRVCATKLQKLVDVAVDDRKYDKVVDHLSTLLLLDGVNRKDILIKRSEARALMESWGDALIDADKVIELDPSSYEGYERRYAALHGAGRHAEAVETFDTLSAKLDLSPHEDVRDFRSRYHDARPTIRHIVSQTIGNMPTILIDTSTGRLYDKSRQAVAFEELPIWNDLVSSMTRELDHARIGTEVKKFYRYVMLSHTWEPGEPRLQEVRDISIHDLESSATHIKLQEFCKLVHALGFRWAWADTICVDQKDNVVLQESLVAMFTWYRGSSLTLIYLRGVSSRSKSGHRISLRRSKWNTRGWTYQEYVAAEIVRFYTEDWEPYLGLTLANHKESPEVISEMQQATGISAHEMAVLQPGLDRIREKLFVASMRQTTRTEDIAYSLLGIFNTSIPVIYGEGNRSVGRLLEHILAASGDVSILAWTGQAGSFNSCLPVDLTVYNELIPPHIPRPVEVVEMNEMVKALRSSLPNPSDAVKLFSDLELLPAPSFAASRLRLSVIICSITKIIRIPSSDSSTNRGVYRATTSLLGDVKIETTAELAGPRQLSLAHPWIHPLLEQEYMCHAGMVDMTTEALRFLARLRKPFGALMLEQVSRHGYKRVAADALIMVQFCEDIGPDKLMKSIATIDIQ